MTSLRNTCLLSAGSLLLAVLCLQPLLPSLLLAMNPNSVRAQERESSLVVRKGTRLYLAGRPFRFSGANIEWAGLVSDRYKGIDDTYYPSPFQVDDALATVHIMGGTVVRAHTLGASAGCRNCIQPALRVFNEDALRRVDYAIKSARQHGIKLIIPLVDGTTGSGWYYGDVETFVQWRRLSNPYDFYTNRMVVEDFKFYISMLLNRKNSYTGIRYKDDPTILGWENCNECGAPSSRPLKPPPNQWIEEIGQHIKQIAPHHLYIDGTQNYGPRIPGSLGNPTVDIVDNHYYPRWSKVFSPASPVTARLLAQDVRDVTAHNQVFISGEFGWDPSNWPTKEGFQQWLDAYRNNPDVAGDLYWNLEAHADNHGFMPVPGPVDAKIASVDQDSSAGGNWWALYYPGIATRWVTAEQMTERVNMLREHAYAMAGSETPHRSPPTTPPVITSTANSHVYWRGSAGAVKYSIQRGRGSSGPWSTLCDRCADDRNSGWNDAAPLRNCWYRVVAWNADGVASLPSAAKWAKNSTANAHD